MSVIPTEKVTAALGRVRHQPAPHTRMDPEGLIAKGCTESGGWFSGMKPANLLDKDKQRINPVDQVINHIPAKASYAHLDIAGFRTDKNGGGAGMGPRSAWTPTTTAS